MRHWTDHANRDAPISRESDGAKVASNPARNAGSGSNPRFPPKLQTITKISVGNNTREIATKTRGVIPVTQLVPAKARSTSSGMYRGLS